MDTPLLATTLESLITEFFDTFRKIALRISVILRDDAADNYDYDIDNCRG